MEWSCFFVLTCLLKIMPKLKRLTLHLHFDIESHPEADWSELDAFFGTSCSSTKLIELFIGTRVGNQTSWSDHDIEPYLMEYPNISKMVKQNELVIISPMMRFDCYCTIL